MALQKGTGRCFTGGKLKSSRGYLTEHAFFFTHSALHNREGVLFPCLSLSQTHFNPVHKRVWWIWVSRLGVPQSHTCGRKKEGEKRKRNQSGDSPNYLCLPRCYVSAPAEHSPETPSSPSADAAPVSGFLRAGKLNYGIMRAVVWS